LSLELKAGECVEAPRVLLAADVLPFELFAAAAAAAAALPLALLAQLGRRA